MIKDEF